MRATGRGKPVAGHHGGTGAYVTAGRSKLCNDRHNMIEELPE
jgi:hypothetical protein